MDKESAAPVNAPRKLSKGSDSMLKQADSNFSNVAPRRSRSASLPSLDVISRCVKFGSGAEGIEVSFSTATDSLRRFGDL